eukprot:symbB.v1.2.030222.t2/scaffold3380.1/size79486/8
MWRLLLALLVRGYSDNASCPSSGGLGLLQKSPSLQRLTVDAEVAQEKEWVAVDGGTGRACRGKSAGDNLASYFTVNSGLASLSACQSLCENTTGCKGVEYHTSGRCEIWTRPGGIEASISLSGYSCYALEMADFIPVDTGINRVCRGDDATDDQANYKEVSSVASLGECKELCRGNIACKGIEFSNTRCEVWTRSIGSSAMASGSQCLKLEFAFIDGAESACRGSSASDNNPAHYKVVSGASEAECKQACRAESNCKGIEQSPGRCEVWTRDKGIQATVQLSGFKCLEYQGSGFTASTTTTAPTSTSTSTTGPSESELAQFLIQSTFGPTLASLKALSETSFQQWIDEQIMLPVESHREYWRKRTNPYVSSADIDDGEVIGAPRSRCDPGSRWIGFTFERRDIGKAVKVSNSKIFVNEVHRTDIDPAFDGNGLASPQACSNNPPEYWQSRGYTCDTIDQDSFSWQCRDESWREQESCQQRCFDLGHGYPGDDCSTGWVGVVFNGFLCNVKADAVGAWVELSTSSDCTVGLKAMSNPHVWRANPTAEMTQSLNFKVFHLSVLHLAASPPQCNLGTVVRSDVEIPGRYYMLQSRLELVENTIQKPASSGSWAGGTCPAVSKTFLNEGSCKLLPGCLPLGLVQVEVVLNPAAFEKFFSVSGRYVYAITGLRTSSGPCNRRSRWKKLDCSTESCSASSLSADDQQAIQSELAGASAQGWLRDVDISCSSNVAAQRVVEVGNDHFQHVHLDEFNTYDFTDWVSSHPGGPDKITQWTSQGYLLQYPSWHGMDRWDEGLAPGVLRPNLVGKFRESISFQSLPQPLQTQDLMDAFASGVADSQEFSTVCGSPGEVANDAFLGHQLSITHGGDYDWHFDMDYHSRWGTDRLARASVWTMHALYAQDQLRQRMAWALSQVLVLAVNGFEGQTEMWLNYYDIFVRNAFGSFRDVLREVTYNPIMGDYLTFKRNRAFDESNNYPDENFAREIMQLFTIGLWKLNPDGTRMKDAAGQDIPTYSNEHIMNFARVFTGFDEQSRRDNIERAGGRNFIDPMRINARWHDVYPKPDLDGNFLGDGYPLCSDLPPAYFLLQGAKFEFLGHTYQGSDVLNLDSTSQLFQKLCGSSSSPCTHTLTVELDTSLTCNGPECTMDTVSVVNVSGGYYQYLPPRCVNLFFFNGQVTRRGGRAWGWTDRCDNPHLPVAGTACCGGCKNRKDWWWMDNRGHCSCENATTVCPSLFTERCNKDETWREQQWCRLACWENGVGYEGDDCSKGAWRGERVCGHQKEFVRMATAKRQCSERGLDICWERLEGYECEYDEEHVWTDETCTYQVLVHADGKVSSNLTSRTRQNKFYVPWKGSSFPRKSGTSCPSGCQTFADGCTCTMNVQVRRAFSSMPSSSQVSSLRIGAVKPGVLCTSCSGAVKAYGDITDPETVLEYQGRFYKNKEVVVLVGDTFEFRNPPAFVTLDNPDEKDVHSEVESLLDHLVYHNNTAPFISKNLIQRFTTSNPSPEYVKAVADAFKTGSYAGRTYQGVYGDLGATVAAILLHPEARSQTSATNGAMREPLIKVIHFMRSMEYKDNTGRNVLFSNLMPLIGQFPYSSPSVFNYYLPGFKPSDFPEGTVGPEFEIFTPPMAISFMNGMTSLIERGLGPSHCGGGFGFEAPQNCSNGELHLGELECVQPTIDQMDLLLTGSSLSVIHAHGSDTVRALEQKIVPQVGAGNAVKLVFEGRVLAPQERVSEVLENNAVLDVICRRSQVFTASMDGNIKVWGTSQGECQATLTGHQGPVTSLALSADNQYLVSGSEDCTARIWNLETLECQHVLAEHFEAIHAVAISPDQKLVVTGGADRVAILWSREHGSPQVALEGHGGSIQAVAFSPAGATILTASLDCTVRYWSSRTGLCVMASHAHERGVYSGSFSLDGTLVLTSSCDGSVRVWKAGVVKPRTIEQAHSGCVYSAAFSPAGRLAVTSGWDRLAKIWDLASGRCLHVLRDHLGPVYSVCFSQDGNTVLTAGKDSTAKIWSVACGEVQLTLKGHGGPVMCAIFRFREVDAVVVDSGGRLHDSAKIKSAYQLADGGHEYKTAQMAMVLTPEFHTLGSPLPLGPRTPEVPEVVNDPRSYKALVMVFLAGGADTYNMLVPMNCPLYDEYTEVRASVALSPSELNSISTAGQSCGEFGIHARLPILKELYDSQHAAFLSNIGSLAEPLSKDQWEIGTGQRCTGLFSHSDQQQAAQTLTCQYSGSSQKGAGGRIADALASGEQKYRTMSFSVAGMSTWPQGRSTPAEIIDQRSGTVSFNHYDRLKTVIDNITSVRHGNIYAEEFSTKFAKALKFNQELEEQLKSAKLQTPFPTNEIDLSRQLKQVARLISARTARKAERDVFYVEIGGWDTHSSVSSELNGRFTDLNAALTSFVNELKAQSIFDSTTIMTHSDFARTLTPNSGEGTDHAWGGNYVMLGGALKGGRIYNDFPASFKEGSAQDAGRGRLIPKYPWENMMVPVAEWMGLESGQISSVFPNIGSFNSSLLLSRSTLFQ